MATTTSNMNMNMIFRGPGSPVSPKSVMMVSKLEEHHDAEKMMKCLPPMGDRRRRTPPASPVTTIDENSKKQDDEYHYEGSSPCYRSFTAKPGDETLFPILRTILPHNKNPLELAERAVKASMDDILMHSLGLQKHHEDALEDIFFGYMQGRRVVLTRSTGISPSLDHDYGLFCADKEQADQFLLALRSLSIQVNELSQKV